MTDIFFHHHLLVSHAVYTYNIELAKLLIPAFCCNQRQRASNTLAVAAAQPWIDNPSTITRERLTVSLVCVQLTSGIFFSPVDCLSIKDKCDVCNVFRLLVLLLFHLVLIFSPCFNFLLTVF